MYLDVYLFKKPLCIEFRKLMTLCGLSSNESEFTKEKMCECQSESAKLCKAAAIASFDLKPANQKLLPEK